MTASSSRALESRTLVVGIGSPHGDDQIGWAVMRQLALQTPGDIEIKTAIQPAELLDWIQDVDQLIICDACQADGATGEIYRWQWPTESIATCKHAGSHDLSLPFVLSLADRLGKLPQRVIVWGVEVGDVSPGALLSEAVRLAIPKLVERIFEDLLVSSSRWEPTRHA